LSLAVFLHGLLNRLPKLAALAERKLGRSSNLLIKVAHPARSRGCLGKIERLTGEMENITNLEFELPATVQNVLRVEVQEAGRFAALTRRGFF
jgi:hypothetical protein